VKQLDRTLERADCGLTSVAVGSHNPIRQPAPVVTHLDARVIDKRCGATVEPGIGNLKKIIDRFSRRGLDAAASEFHLAAAAFNLLKIHRAALS
jgi:hypothetical protein